MIITKLILHKYKRLFLGDIETLILTPENKLSLILGKNGIGKSSLLLQLTPLPANLNKDFKEEGSKIIEISHNEDKYILISGVEGSKKHSFLKNDIEFNPGGTYKVQLELVKEYFKITPHINNILLGVTKFTTMSPNERKRWITEISSVDYSYSISLFNSLKQRHRDITGGIKLLTNNIAKVELEVLADNEIFKINNDIDNLSLFIEHILTLVEHTSDNIADINKILSNIETYNNRLLSLSNDKDISITIDTIDNNITNLEALLNNNVKQTAILNKSIDDIDKSNLYTNNNDNLLNMKKELEMVLNTVTTITSTPNEMIGVKELYNDISTDIVSTVSELVEYDDLDISKDNYDKYYNGCSTLITLITNIEKQIAIIDGKLISYKDLLKDDNKIKCDGCGNEWYNKYDKDVVETLNLERTNLTTRLDNITIKYNNAKVILDRMEAKKVHIRKFKSIMYDNIKLSPVWNYLLSNIDTSKSNIELANRLNLVTIDLNTWNDIINADSKLLKVNNKLQELANYKDIADKLSKDNKVKLLEELETLTDSKYKILKDIEKYKSLRVIKTSYDTTVKNIQDNIKIWYKTKDVAYSKLRNQHLKELITSLKGIMIELTNKINNNNTVKNRVSKDVKLLEEYKTREKVLKLALKELSPSEGLIAKSINSFLNIFLEDINMLINTIWSYDMRILPCEVSETNDLDYKFKVLVDNKEVIEDISKTSSSMQEIIDLVFRIMFMKYMGLHNTPLTLDEFGKTFDTEHRVTAYNTVDRILMSNFTQVFMVSHFESMYGRFVNADICVLNTDGVELNTIDSFNKTLDLL